jgi:ribosome-associated protein YbcJ (S4-like RNA binding protein)
MFRNQLLILSTFTIMAFASSVRAEVVVGSGADGAPVVQTGNVRVGDGNVSIRRNSRLRKQKRYKITPRIYQPTVNPHYDDVDYGQTTTTRSTSTSSSSTVNGRTHRNTQTTTVHGNGRTIIQSNTTD